MSQPVVLVTGAAGFIGFSVSRALAARGATVLGIDDLNPYYDVALKQARLDRLASEDGGRFTFHRGDFAETGALERAVEGREVEAIVHLGAQAGVRHSIERPADYVRSNLVGHANVLEFARQRRVRHLVYASSSSVYGGGPRDGALSVDQRVDTPVSFYAATKRADELMSESYAHLFRIPMTGLRFFTVYGPWGRPDMAVWKFTEAILEGRPIDVFNHGHMRRDFTFIDDIAQGVLAALDHPPADDGQRSPHIIYNLGAGRSEPLERLIEEVERACGRRAERRLAAMQPGDVENTLADIAPARRDLGFDPSTPIEVGVPSFVDWFRSYRAVRA